MGKPNDMTARQVEAIGAICRRRPNPEGIVKKVINAIRVLVSRFTGYWTFPVSQRIQSIRSDIGTAKNKTRILALSALLAATAALLQSAGALGGPGFALSALATLPVAIAAILEVKTGIATYAVSLLLLLLLQPSEIIVFPFTTGLLGLAIGIAFRLTNKRLGIVAFSAFALTLGISFLLYVIGFPVLGPAVAGSFRIITVILIYAFSFLYSWIWVEISTVIFRFLHKAF